MQCDVLIFGTGSLATSTCYALSAMKGSPLRICIVGRSLKLAETIATISTARALCFKTSHQFYADQVIWEDASLKVLLSKYPTQLILVMASLQSAWEFTDGADNEWVKLVNTIGYACTIPFQAYLVSKIAKIVHLNSLPSKIINACYPDVVNALLKASGFEILCGIGNVGIIHKNLHMQMPPSFINNLKIVAHHFHLESRSEDNPFMIWPETDFLPFNYELPLNLCAIKGSELNQLTGAIAAELVIDFFDKSLHLHHVPGPLGLHGGYPVQIGKMDLISALPTAALEQAKQLNFHWSYLEGVVVLDNKFISFSPKIEAELGRFRYLYKSGFHVDDLEKVVESFIGFREILRGKK